MVEEKKSREERVGGESPATSFEAAGFSGEPKNY
jgi:hypothetical protein